MKPSAESLESLQRRREALLEETCSLSGFRTGSITATRGRCGNARCHCHQPGDPGHGPNFRLTFERGGKTLTEPFPAEAARCRAEREIAAFRRWERLSRELVEVNTEIGQRRPVEESLSEQEKRRRRRSGRKSARR